MRQDKHYFIAWKASNFDILKWYLLRGKANDQYRKHSWEKLKKEGQWRQRGNLGQRPSGELRLQVLLPQRGGRRKLYLTVAPRKCCSLRSPISSCLLHALASPSGFSWAWRRQIRHTGVAGSHPSACLVCTRSQTCTSCMRDKVGCFLTHPFLAERCVVQ